MEFFCIEQVYFGEGTSIFFLFFSSKKLSSHGVDLHLQSHVNKTQRNL